jgi:hypothetical protein
MVTGQLSSLLVSLLTYPTEHGQRPKKCVRKSASEKVRPKKNYFLMFVLTPRNVRAAETRRGNHREPPSGPPKHPCSFPPRPNSGKLLPPSTPLPIFIIPRFPKLPP